MLELQTSLRLGGPFSLFGNQGNQGGDGLEALMRSQGQALARSQELQSRTLDMLSRIGRGGCSPYQPPSTGGGCFPAPSPGCPVSPPDCGDSSHPEGSLQVEGDTITTPGGYEIKQLGQHEWSITGPDGATTRIWGDPHVDEGDREGNTDWDFKRNSTFVLGDGTRINVSTKPWGDNGMTVTSGLEVISGNERVEVSDIDRGKGHIGTVTQDGYAHANNFDGADVFVMGDQADDWTHRGREVMSSNNGGESFNLGDEMGVGGNGGGNSGQELAAANERFEQFARALMQNIMQAFQSTMQQFQQQQGTTPATGGSGQTGGANQPGSDYSDVGCGNNSGRNCGRPRRGDDLRQALEDLRQMMQTLLFRFGMNNDFSARRGQMQA